MPTLIEFAKQQAGVVSVKKANRGNGAFMLLTDKDDKALMTLPVGKKSQEGSIADYHILQTAEGVFICTVNPIVEEEVTL